MRMWIVALVGTDRVNGKGDCFNHIVDEINSVRLSIARTGSQSFDSGGVVYSPKPETRDLFVLVVW